MNTSVKTLVGEFNETTIDWLRESGVIKYTKSNEPDFFIDLDATKEIAEWVGSDLNEFTTLFRCNCGFEITEEEILQHQYVHVKLRKNHV
jgi:hypothetical protein